MISGGLQGKCGKPLGLQIYITQEVSIMSIRAKRIIAYLLLVAVIALHMDFWFWGDTTLVFGWWPIENFFHWILITVISTLVMFVFSFWGVPQDVSEAIKHPNK
jgi:uncharacterized membrane protein